MAFRFGGSFFAARHDYIFISNRNTLISPPSLSDQLRTAQNKEAWDSQPRSARQWRIVATELRTWTKTYETQCKPDRFCNRSHGMHVKKKVPTSSCIQKRDARVFPREFHRDNFHSERKNTFPDEGKFQNTIRENQSMEDDIINIRGNVERFDMREVASQSRLQFNPIVCPADETETLHRLYCWCFKINTRCCPQCVPSRTLCTINYYPLSITGCSVYVISERSASSESHCSWLSLRTRRSFNHKTFSKAKPRAKSLVSRTHYLIARKKRASLFMTRRNDPVEINVAALNSLSRAPIPRDEESLLDG